VAAGVNGHEDLFHQVRLPDEGLADLLDDLLGLFHDHDAASSVSVVLPGVSAGSGPLGWETSG